MVDVVTNLAALVPLIQTSPRQQWFGDIRSWKGAYPFVFEQAAPGERPKPQEVIEELDKLTKERKDEVIIST